jgi:hypothetical protein
MILSYRNVEIPNCRVADIHRERHGPLLCPKCSAAASGVPMVALPRDARKCEACGHVFWVLDAERYTIEVESNSEAE